MQVLRLSRPRDKSLSDALTGSPPAKKLCQGGGRKTVRRERGEKGEDGQALAEIDVGGPSCAKRRCQRAAGRSYVSGSPSARRSVSSSASASPTNWSSAAAERASVTLPRS